MKSIRLNKESRERIINNMAEQELWPTYKKLLETNAELTEQARQFCYGGKVKQAEEAAKDIRRLNESVAGSYSLFTIMNGPEQRSMKVNLGGYVLKLAFETNFKFVVVSPTIGIEYQCIAEARCAQRETVVVKDEALCKKLIANDTAIRNFKAEAKAVIAGAQAVVKQSRTVESLLEVWPESKKFIPEDIGSAKATANLPLAIGQLNESLKKLSNVA
ncbi:Nmad5 family putative nucleotide modification protein [Cobetia sp. SIMBA_158]|uniref:Nmad5 family putative nucleotide modification protein n=1 Tax=Cobetia sp. SIMBA_158 TaxID=3081617 RepID=UPI0039814CB7